MFLPKETLELIQQTARDAQAARLLPELGDGRTAFVQQGDAIKNFPIAPAVRLHEVRNLVDLIAYALRPDNPRPVVWHGPGGVVLVLDDADRRDRVVFPLTFSDRYLTLAKLAESRPALSQAQFVRLLRVDLGLNALVVKQFRRLDWQDGRSGAAEISHGNERISQSIVAKIQGVDELPDELQVPTPVYRQDGERTEYLVRCFVEVDPANQVFGFGPMPDEMTKIIDRAQADIRSRLDAGTARDDGQIPTYYGQP